MKERLSIKSKNGSWVQFSFSLKEPQPLSPLKKSIQRICKAAFLLVTEPIEGQSNRQAIMKATVPGQAVSLLPVVISTESTGVGWHRSGLFQGQFNNYTVWVTEAKCVGPHSDTVLAFLYNSFKSKVH